MKKVLLPAMIAIAGWSGAAHSDAGIGMSIQSGDATLFVPIDLGAFRLEPSLFYSRDKVEQVTLVPPGIAVEQTRKITTYRLGVGLFGLAGLSDSIRAYYGGRIAYQSSENELQSSGGFGSTSSDLDGFQLAPTLGIEYFFTDKFSIAGEASLVYTELEDDNDLGTESTDTDTNVVVRYRF